MQIDVDAGSTQQAPPPATKPSKKRGSVLSSKDDKDDASAATSDPTGTDKQLDDFFSQVNAIKVLGGKEWDRVVAQQHVTTQSMLGDIRDKQHAIEAHHERSTFVTRTEEVKAAKVPSASSKCTTRQHTPCVQAAMQTDINEVQRLAHATKAKLEALDKANARAAHQPVHCWY